MCFSFVNMRLDSWLIDEHDYDYMLNWGLMIMILDELRVKSIIYVICYYIHVKNWIEMDLGWKKWGLGRKLCFSALPILIRIMVLTWFGSRGNFIRKNLLLGFIRIRDCTWLWSHGAVFISDFVFIITWVSWLWLRHGSKCWVVDVKYYLVMVN